MTKKQLIELGLSEELSEKVLDVHKEAMKGFIPKSRFDEINNSKKELESQLTERDTQLKELEKSAGTSEELKKQITDLQTKNETAAIEYESKLKQAKIESAIELGLTSSKARNSKAVKALLDIEKIELTEGGVKGLEEQLEALKTSEDSKFLFGSGDITFNGIKPGEPKAPKEPEKESLGARLAKMNADNSESAKKAQENYF